MNDRIRKTDGLRYRMNANPGARQPSGLGPTGIEFLRREGGLAEDPRPEPIPFPSPDMVGTAAPAEPAGAPAASPEPPATPTARPEPNQSTPGGSSPPKQPAPTGGSPPTQPSRLSKKRTRQSKGDAYALSPSRKRQPSRSNHFRLPADVEAHLKELAAQYECSRTHVVCSVISSEWQRLKRRQSRSSKATVTPA